jgi:hypothetical protein
MAFGTAITIAARAPSSTRLVLLSTGAAQPRALRHSKTSDPNQHPQQQPNLFHCTQAGNTNTHNYSSSPPPLFFFFNVARLLRPGLPLQQGLITAHGDAM